MRSFLGLVLLSLLSTWTWSNSFVVSTQPIFLIAKEITKGVETPELLLSQQSGHDVQVTPAHRQQIQQAELIIWIGEQHEAPLKRMLAGHSHAFSLLKIGILKTLPLRDPRGQAIANSVDAHIWLEPNNAVRIGFFIAALRAQQHPEHKDAYWANAKQFANQMLQAAQSYESGTTARPYWAYHDAYQYLERALNLNFAGALTDDPHMAPTVAQMKYLNDERPKSNMCLLAEGHAQPSHYRSLQPVVFESVDESMADETNFVQAWLNLAKKVNKCVLLKAQIDRN